MNYLVVVVKAADTDCHLESIANVPDRHQLRFGIPFKDAFPDDASFTMNSEFPKGLRLTDALHNLTSVLVFSERLKGVLESIPGALFNNEVLPVKIINHKGRTEKAKYWIVHPIDHPQCVDEGATIGTRNPIERTHFQLVKKLVLDEKKIDEKVMLFRAAQYPAVHLIRRDLAKKLDAEKFTGLSFAEIDDYRFFGK